MKVIPGLFIVKIIVPQGDPSCLYSITTDLLQCYVRYEDQSKILFAKETKEAIIERFLHPLQRIPLEVFSDPMPDQIQDVEGFPKVIEGEFPYRRKLKDDRKEDFNNENYMNLMRNESDRSSDFEINPNLQRGFVTFGRAFKSNFKNVRDSAQSAQESSVTETTMPGSLGAEMDQSFIRGEIDPNLFRKSGQREDGSIMGSRATSDFDQNQALEWEKFMMKNEVDIQTYRSISYVPEESFVEHAPRGKMSEEPSPISFLPNQLTDKKKPGHKITRDRHNTDKAAYKRKQDPREICNDTMNLRNSFEGKRNAMFDSTKQNVKGQPQIAWNSDIEVKKKNVSQDGQKGYYSHLLETMNNMQINGKNQMKVHEVFVEGLPITWTQEDFESFVQDLKLKSIFSSRMFKKDTGLCNGKAFFNFTDREEASQFISNYNNTNFFGKLLFAKFKQ